MGNLRIIIFIFLFILLGIYSLFIEPNKLEVTHYKIQDTKLKDIKIVFASDFHIKPHQQKRLEKIIETINTESPDLVLSVGDFVSGHNAQMTMPIEDIAKGLIEENGKRLITTTGIGTSILPVRFNCAPEIVVIEF